MKQYLWESVVTCLANSRSDLAVHSLVLQRREGQLTVERQEVVILTLEWLATQILSVDCIRCPVHSMY